MKIDKAIEILSSVARGLVDTNATGELDAVKLAVEALKELKESRKTDWHYDGSLLPSET